MLSFVSHFKLFELVGSLDKTCNIWNYLLPNYDADILPLFSIKVLMSLTVYPKMMNFNNILLYII